MIRIAVLLETTYDNARRILGGIHDEVNQHPDWDTLAFRQEYPPPQVLRQWGACGILGAFTKAQPSTPYHNLSIPIVNVSSRPQRAPTVNISVDHLALGRLAARHLKEQCVRHLGLVIRPGKRFSIERARGFRQAAGVTIPQSHVVSLPAPLPDSLEVLRAWLPTLPEGCGIFAVGDLEARLVLAAAQSISIPVPGRLAIMGANNEIETCRSCKPHLSSVDARGDIVGQTAAHIMDMMLKGERVHDTLISAGQVYARGSSDRLAVIEDDLVRQAIALMRQHLADGIDINGVLQNLCVSSKTLEIHFQGALGRTPLAELHRIRLEQAKNLLLNTGLSVNQISERVGCSRVGHFITFFRKHIGLTPGAFRTSNRHTNSAIKYIE